MTKATPISTLVPYTTLFRSPMQRIRALEGSHPLPDANSLASTYELIDLATKIPDGYLVFYLLSGGSSTLLCRPADELELDEDRKSTRLNSSQVAISYAVFFL